MSNEIQYTPSELRKIAPAMFNRYNAAHAAYRTALRWHDTCARGLSVSAWVDANSELTAARRALVAVEIEIDAVLYGPQ